MSSDTYKGKAAYSRISPDPAKAGSYWEVVVVVVFACRNLKCHKLQSLVQAAVVTIAYDVGK